MRYPNLAWALANNRKRQYQLANELKVSESWLSRALAGRAQFTPEQRKRIAEYCGYGEAWLFKIAAPPPPTEREPVAAST